MPHEGVEPSLRQESGFEPDASTSSANGAMVPVEQPKRIGILHTTIGTGWDGIIRLDESVSE